MCASCGCAEANQRHQPGDITVEDIENAASNHSLNTEQVAENIRKAVERSQEPTLA